jgi:hypothetical protein
MSTILQNNPVWTDYKTFSYAQGLYESTLRVIDGEFPETGLLNQQGFSSGQSSQSTINRLSLEKTGSLLGTFEVDFYNRVHVSPPLINLENITSGQEVDLYVWNAYEEQRDLISITSENSDGITIDGDSPPSTWQPLEEKLYSISISPFGPPSVDAIYYLNWVSIQSNLISITGSRVTTFKNEFQSPMIETLEWQTSIIQANDGGEVLSKIRSTPRHSIEISCPIDRLSFEEFENTLYGWRQRSWALPLWHEKQKVGLIEAGQSIININTIDFDYTVGGLVFISNNIEKLTLQIESFDDNQIQISDVFANDISGAWVMPVRNAQIKDDPIKEGNGVKYNSKVKFELTDNTEIEEAAESIVQKDGYDVYVDDLFSSSELQSREYSMKIDSVDFGSGAFELDSPWEKPKVKSEKTIHSTGIADVKKFKMWLSRRSGKYLPFYYPTFESNIKPQGEGAISNSILIEDSNYSLFSSNRNSLFVKLNDGSHKIAEANSHTNNGNGTETIGLVENLDVNYSEIKYISFLMLVRLNSDSASIKWESGCNIESNLEIIEL